MVSSDLLCHIGLVMQYEDDEGDGIILTTDDYLMNAITYVRLSGAKVLCSCWFNYLSCLSANTIDSMFTKLS